MAAVPVANEKSQVNIVKQQWFTDAVGQMENLHFSDTACAESVWRSILPLLLGRILKPCRGADK